MIINHYKSLYANLPVFRIEFFYVITLCNHKKKLLLKSSAMNAEVLNKKEIIEMHANHANGLIKYIKRYSNVTLKRKSDFSKAVYFKSLTIILYKIRVK